MKTIVAFIDRNSNVLASFETNIVPNVGDTISIDGVDTEGFYRRVSMLSYKYGNDLTVVGASVSDSISDK